MIKNILKSPIKVIGILLLIGLFVGDVIFTELINPASEWLYNFNVPIINISFGAFSLFVLIIGLLIYKLLGNNPDV